MVYSDTREQVPNGSYYETRVNFTVCGESRVSPLMYVTNRCASTNDPETTAATEFFVIRCRCAPLLRVQTVNLPFDIHRIP